MSAKGRKSDKWILKVSKEKYNMLLDEPTNINQSLDEISV